MQVEGEAEALPAGPEAAPTDTGPVRSRPRHRAPGRSHSAGHNKVPQAQRSPSPARQEAQVQTTPQASPTTEQGTAPSTPMVPLGVDLAHRDLQAAVDNVQLLLDQTAIEADIGREVEEELTSASHGLTIITSSLQGAIASLMASQRMTMSAADAVTTAIAHLAKRRDQDAHMAVATALVINTGSKLLAADIDWADSASAASIPTQEGCQSPFPDRPRALDRAQHRRLSGRRQLHRLQDHSKEIGQQQRRQDSSRPISPQPPARRSPRQRHRAQKAPRHSAQKRHWPP